MRVAKFLGAFAQAVNRAVTVIAEHPEKRMESLAKKREKDGVLVPATHLIAVGDQAVEVPRMTVTKMSGMALDEAEFELDAMLDLVEDDDGKLDIDIRLSKGLLRRATHARVRVKFSQADTPEGLNVIRDALVRRTRGKTDLIH